MIVSAAAIGSKALYLLFLWLLSAAGAAWLAERKGYTERVGLTFGLVLTFVGFLIVLLLPGRPGSAWKVDGPLPKRRAPWRRRRRSPAQRADAPSQAAGPRRRAPRSSGRGRRRAPRPPAPERRTPRGSHEGRISSSPPATLRGAEAQLGAVGVRRATVAGLLGDGGRHRRRDLAVEHRGDDVVLAQLVVGDDVGDRPGGGRLHRLRDGGGADVEGAAEHPGEAEHVVDLVRVVGPAGGDDAGVARRLLGRDLRVRVGHGEDDRVRVHRRQRLGGQDPGAGEADEQVGALDHRRRRSVAMVEVGPLGERAA